MNGAQVLEQHKYMECRWVSLSFTPAAPANFTLSGWKVHYPWDGADTSFTSSNATLNAVWELSRYTLEAASLDTYTDSNTRERRPYEADGIIAATARLLIQRDYMWPRRRRNDAVRLVRPPLTRVGVGVRVEGGGFQRVPAELPHRIQRGVA